MQFRISFARNARHTDALGVMLVATYNINNVNRRLPNLLSWLKARQPDVACLLGQTLQVNERLIFAPSVEIGTKSTMCGRRDNGQNSRNACFPRSTHTIKAGYRMTIEQHVNPN
jgi:exonuclease III